MVTYKFEKDQTGRACCRECKKAIKRGQVRLRVSLSMNGDYFVHPACAPARALNWMRKQGATEKRIPGSLHGGSLTPGQLNKLQNIFARAQRVMEAKQKARQVLAKRPAAKAAACARTAELRSVKAATQAKYFVGRKGIVSKWHFGGRHLTNHFVKVTGCTAKYITVQEYEKKTSNIFGEPIEGRHFIHDSIDLVEADWTVKRKSAGKDDTRCTHRGILGVGHKVHVNHVTGSFGKWKKCEVTGDDFLYSYAFDGDITDRALDGSVPDWVEAVEIPGDALHVRAFSGKLLLCLPKEEAVRLRAVDVSGRISKRVGSSSNIELTLGGVKLKDWDQVKNLFTEEGSIVLNAILSDKEPMHRDGQGRLCPRLICAREAPILNINQALDDHRDPFCD